MTAEQPSVAGSLAVQYPGMACEWDTELNPPLTANMITPGSKWTLDSAYFLTVVEMGVGEGRSTL